MSINTTANTAGTTKLNKTFYDRQLLESAKTRFVHAKYGQKRPIPKNSGKRVEFRKWNLFDANDAMEALQEGRYPCQPGSVPEQRRGGGGPVRRIRGGIRPAGHDRL